MIGNAHIDPVWLWDWRAGADEVLATFRSAADRCDEYPGFIFTAGEAWRYEPVERLDPGLFKRIEVLVAKGQWSIPSPQYIQPDCNLPTGAGWRRQLSVGAAYFVSRFGIRPRIGYNVDSFGHPASLPDILAEAGCVGYVFHRPAPFQVQLPAQAFRWRGCGGAEVIGYQLLPSYVTRAADIPGQLQHAMAGADPELGHAMCFYGVGNHGGGPTKAQIEFILANPRYQDAEVRFSTPDAFFTAIEGARDRLPLVTKELQHTFPGCYSVMHDVKQRQRRTERILDQAERVIEQLVPADERGAWSQRLEPAWRDALFTQFHDVLGGTSVASAWEGVRDFQSRARLAAEEAIFTATRRAAAGALPPINMQQAALYNPDRDDWAGIVDCEPWLDFDDWGDRWVSDAEGRPVDHQLVQAQASMLTTRVLFEAAVPAQGWSHLLIRDDPRPAMDPPPAALAVSEAAISNNRVAVELAPTGIRQVTLDGVPLLGENGWTLHWRQDNTDTWTFLFDHYSDPIQATLGDLHWEVEESGPLRAAARAVGRIGQSAISIWVRLRRDSTDVEVEVEVNADAQLSALQMPVHLATTPGTRVDGLAGGSVARDPGPTEWPLQGWSRVNAGGTALALLTEDAYSVSHRDDLWQWTLLRTPEMAYPGGRRGADGGRRRYTDQGVHGFRFILVAGSELSDQELHRRSRQLGQPPVVFDRYEGLNRPPWGQTPPDHLRDSSAL